MLVLPARVSWAVDIPLPPVNLGDTNFQDAIAYPGWLVEELFTYYRAKQFSDYQGNERPGSNRITVKTAVTHVAWISNFKLLGGFYGAEVLVPLAQLDVKTEFGPRDQDRGVGDVSVSPFSSNGPNPSFSACPSFSAWIFSSNCLRGITVAIQR